MSIYDPVAALERLAATYDKAEIRRAVWLSAANTRRHIAACAQSEEERQYHLRIASEYERRGEQA